MFKAGDYKNIKKYLKLKFLLIINFTKMGFYSENKNSFLDLLYADR